MAVPFRTTFLRRTFLALLTTVFATAALAQSGAATTLRNNTPGFIKKAVNKGPVDPSTVITITAWLNLRNQQALDALVKQQYTRGAAQYHKWITQAQFNNNFGATPQQATAVKNFLAGQNFKILHVAEDSMYVKAQGTVAQVQKTFHVTIDQYSFKGATYRSNTADPTVPAIAGGLIDAITGMDDYGFQPALVRATSPDGAPAAMRPLTSTTPQGTFFEGQCFTGVESHTFTGGGNTATYDGNRYGAPITNNTLGSLPPCGYSPIEIQTAYNLGALYANGLTGAGKTVVITDAYGSPTIRRDAEVFSQVYGLPDLTTSNFQVYRAPGVVNNPHGAGWDGETTLDVEWAHAIAPGANIALVVGPTNHSDLDEAIHWAVIHHLGDVISNSWSTVEGFGNPRQFDRINRILEMAAAQGIDVNFATGDFGDWSSVLGGFKTVAFPASSPWATAVGGISLGLNADDSIALQTGWGNNLTMIAGTNAQGNAPRVPPLNEGFIFGAGGGFSYYYAKPAWQTGVPGTRRAIPDISWLADPYTGVEIIETVGGQLSVGVIGGTSLATPMFSALMSIADQKAGHNLGQAAPLVYGLGSSAVTDIPEVSSPTHVSGTINGSPVSADALAAPLDGATAYYSAFYNSPFSTRWFVITFGTDSSLHTTTGWDDVTGVGVPSGPGFVNAIAP